MPGLLSCYWSKKGRDFKKGQLARRKMDDRFEDEVWLFGCDIRKDGGR